MSMHKKYGFANLKKGLPLPPHPATKPTIRRSHFEGFYAPDVLILAGLTFDFRTTTFTETV